MEKITDKIAALPEDATYFSLEFFPPKTQMGSSNLQTRLERMSRGLRPLFVTVTWGAGGSTASKSLELAELCQRQLGLTTSLHLTCTNMSRQLVDDALEQAKALGVRNILALRGDPPRSEEYREVKANGEMQSVEDDSNREFTWAVDLVRYIRKKYGDYFCVGVAAYPEGHSDMSVPQDQDPLQDLPYLVEKVKAGAEFLMTQLFYDVDAYIRYEKLLRSHHSGVFKDIIIIPGLMPVQSYQVLRRTTKLSHARLPPGLLARLDEVKRDDEAVKRVGVQILSEIVETIKGVKSDGPRGFHFYTLNLEKSVAHILENCHLIPPSTPNVEENGVECIALEASSEFLLAERPMANGSTKERRRMSSANSGPRNRVIVERPSQSSSNASYEAAEDEAGVPKDKINSRANTLAISEGEGTLGREATWDDFPNGRFGDARSPAYGEIDGYGVSLHVSVANALKLWGHPVTRDDISLIFRRHLEGELEAIPWSEEDLSAETQIIKAKLLQMIRKGWWTVASQPAVNAVRSTDPVLGWGPRNGFVFQKAFVEFFLPAEDWRALRSKLERRNDDGCDEVTFFAGDDAGHFESSDEDSVNPVTWGTFRGKEIVSPTIIEAVSFKAWLDEAFGIWKEWRLVYPSASASRELLDNIRREYWLVNIIHHRYVDENALWDLLLRD